MFDGANSEMVELAGLEGLPNLLQQEEGLIGIEEILVSVCETLKTSPIRSCYLQSTQDQTHLRVFQLETSLLPA